jgi:hypothetical protein
MRDAEPPQETPMEGPEVHAPHAPHTGHRWWDFAIGGTAVLVSLISLYVAVHHGEIMEKLVAANSWPNVELSVNVAAGALIDSSRFEISLTNNGVGPARIETLELWHGQLPIKNVDAIRRLVMAKSDGQNLNFQVQSATVVGAVIGASQTVKPVVIESTMSDVWPMVETAGGLKSRVCFCSVFDECRVADTRAPSPRPVVVASCPVPEIAFRDDVNSLMLSRASAPPAQ